VTELTLADGVLFTVVVVTVPITDFTLGGGVAIGAELVFAVVAVAAVDESVLGAVVVVGAVEVVAGFDFVISSIAVLII